MPPEIRTPRRRVLVVEDDSQLTGVIVRSLAQMGVAAEGVRDGAEALPAIRRLRPDLVLLDLDLPSVQGLEICRRLKRDPELSGIPIVIMTAHSAEIDRIVGLELGADDYVSKPFSVRELTLRVQAVLRRAHGAPPAV